MVEAPRKPVSWRGRAGVAVGLLGLAAAVLGWRSTSTTSNGKAFRSPSAAEARDQSLEASVAPAESVAAPSPPREGARRVSIGRAIFFDPNLSVPPGTSCSSCHDPRRGFAGSNGSHLGVAAGSRPEHFAKRNTPSVLYLRFVRKFHLHWEEDKPLVDAYGGFFWDGRVDSLVELVKQPLLNPNEMNNGGAPHIRETVAAAAYAPDFREEFGPALDDPEATLEAAGEAVSAYLLSPEMSPFTSKYDDYVRGRAQLSASEARGLALFKDSSKGACSACHKLNDRSSDPAASLFTDYGFDAVGVPRNRALPTTRDASQFDLGLCERADAEYKANTEEFCGRFRTPSLRNVAVRESFMHNGAFSKLRDVVAFYATRDIDPKRWYRYGPAFDDVPTKYRQNVNVDKAPYNRRQGQTPPLDEGEIDAVVAFLGTLTDAQMQ